MTTEYRSMADQLGQLVDCSVMMLEVEFSNITIDLVKEAAHMFCECIQRIYGHAFVASWRQGYRDERISEKGLQSAIDDAEYSVELEVSANARTISMQTEKQFRSFQVKLRKDTTLKWDDCSADFEDYFQKNLQPVWNDPGLKKALVELFQVTGRKNIGHYNYVDSYGTFFSSPESYQSKILGGSIRFYLAVGCLDGSVSRMAERFVDCMKQLCNLLVFANGRVGIVPSPMYFCHPHSVYFNWDALDQRKLAPRIAAPEGCDLRLWRKVAYCGGYSWANVVSGPALRRLSGHSQLPESSSFILTELLPCGSLFVKLAINIDKADVPEMAQMKRFLYPVLSPGCSYWSRKKSNLQWIPRHNWDLLSVAEDEISLFDDWIVFHKE